MAAAALYAKWSGSTVSVSGGNMAGLPRFAVSTYPQRTVELIVAPTWELLFAFAIVNSDLLVLPDHALGTWVDCERNRHVLDVVVCPLSLDEAIDLGISHGQSAIYDLEARKEIPLATCGEEITASPFGANYVQPPDSREFAAVSGWSRLPGFVKRLMCSIREVTVGFRFGCPKFNMATRQPYTRERSEVI